MDHRDRAFRMVQEAPADRPQQPPPDRGLSWLNWIASLTLTQVLIIALLVIIAIPTYILWRALNDASMLNTFLSRYEEFTNKTSCVLRVASLRGGGDTWAISTGFAVQGNDRYNVTVILGHKPDDAELESYCATLDAIVDYMRRPDAPMPTYPNSEEPLIWQYPAQ